MKELGVYRGGHQPRTQCLMCVMTMPASRHMYVLQKLCHTSKRVSNAATTTASISFFLSYLQNLFRDLGGILQRPRGGKSHLVFRRLRESTVKVIKLQEDAFGVQATITIGSVLGGNKHELVRAITEGLVGGVVYHLASTWISTSKIKRQLL